MFVYFVIIISFFFLNSVVTQPFRSGVEELNAIFYVNQNCGSSVIMSFSTWIILDMERMNQSEFEDDNICKMNNKQI